MKWGKVVPTAPGWYWWRIQYKTGIETGYIERVYEVGADDYGAFVSGIGSVSTLGGEWAGPIPQPTEDTSR